MTENLPRLAQAVVLLSVLWGLLVVAMAILDRKGSR